MIQKIQKLDNTALAMIAGLVVPAIFTAILVAIEAAKLHKAFFEYFTQLLSYGLETNLLALATIPDLGLFYFFLNKKMYKSTKGIIAAVFIIIAYVIFVKFLR